MGATALVGATGARARKRLETHLAIMEAARQLVLQRGLDAVTVADIAAAADVSISTFFNYFDRKEDAIVGSDPLVVAATVAALHARPASEGPVDALKAALKGTGEAQLHRWQLRNELVLRHPELAPSHLAALAEIESTLASALAERLGVDPRRTPRVRMVVAMVLAASRAGIEWWDQTGRTSSLDVVVDEAFDMLTDLRVAEAHR